MSNKQKNITSFFGAGASSAPRKKAKVEKENSASTETQEQVPTATQPSQVPATNQVEPKAGKKRRTVVEDDEEGVPLPKRPALEGQGEAHEESTHAQQKEEEDEDEDEQDEEEEDERDAEDPSNPTSTESKIVRAIINWNAGDSVPYAAVVDAFEKISGTTKRLEITRILCTLFRAVLVTTPEDLHPIVFLASCEVAPTYQGMQLGIGDAILRKAIVEATGRTADAVKRDLEKEGDIGTVAQLSKSKQRTLGFGQKLKPLSARHVWEQLKAIAEVKGHKSQDQKANFIKKMMLNGTPVEAKYIFRALQGKLRIGLSQRTVLVSLAHAFVLSPPSTLPDTNGSTEPENEDNEGVSEPPLAKEMRVGLTKGALPRDRQKELAVMLINQAFAECPNYNEVIKALLRSPVHRLFMACRLTPGIPVSPMLAKPSKSFAEVLSRMSGQLFTCEYKYDGERAQVHLFDNGTVKIFSRNTEDMTEKYPELKKICLQAMKPGMTSFVIDCEVIAYDSATNSYKAFQVLSTRKKKADGNDGDSEVPVILMAFDMLYLNGEPLLTRPLLERREALRSSFSHVQGQFELAKSIDHQENGDTAPIEAFMTEAIAASCEGLMLKTLTYNATYEPARRTLNWLKLKKDYLDGSGVADSVDLVPIGAYHGMGKRVGVFGAYLMACYDADTETFQSVCKIGTGFSDSVLSSLTAALTPHVIDYRPSGYLCGESLEPDVWFEAARVWEVKAADLSLSSTHKGAIGLADPRDSSRGIGLRFPRFIRERDDKTPSSATLSSQILEMYRSQAHTQAQAATDDADDDYEI